MPRLNQFATGFVVGVASTVTLCSSLGAVGLGLTWTKNEVMPVCMVRAEIGGFKPLYGEDISNTWQRADVTPMCEVKPKYGRFVPMAGQGIGNEFDRKNVRAFIHVKPDGDEFVPLH
jgi:hypothetical protein